uniref:Uncharacterized protein n=1 Tax=Anguilla anguilla TaxID=7936 RepID=A0A0E9XBF7_ANGAN
MRYTQFSNADVFNQSDFNMGSKFHYGQPITMHQTFKSKHDKYANPTEKWTLLCVHFYCHCTEPAIESAQT